MVTEVRREEPRGVEVVAVAGNSAHASVVMHVSSLRPRLRGGSRPIGWWSPPMDLLGDPPPPVDSVEPGVDSAVEMVAPTPEVDQAAASVSTPVLLDDTAQPVPPPLRVEPPLLSDDADQWVPPPLEDPVLDAPNPFRTHQGSVVAGRPRDAIASAVGALGPPGSAEVRAPHQLLVIGSSGCSGRPPRSVGAVAFADGQDQEGTTERRRASGPP
ncbi:MAG: hypothetical protein M5U19_23175 [Microthrixaceae bacterium]|nr:hypothetical protein [Microthrixaceae bacterium]